MKTWCCTESPYWGGGEDLGLHGECWTGRWRKPLDKVKKSDSAGEDVDASPQASPWMEMAPLKEALTDDIRKPQTPHGTAPEESVPKPQGW